MKPNVLKIIVTIASLGALALTACGFNVTNPDAVTHISGSGKVVTESRTVGGFNGLVVNGTGKILIDQTGQESLSITADDNFMSYIVTEVRGGKLVIEFKSNVVADKVTDLTFKLTVKDLNSIELNGAAVVEANSLDSARLTVSVRGAGAVKTYGKIDQQDVSLNGAGAYNAEHVEGKRAMVTNSGAGAAIVRVSDSLNATINGIGFIEYIGNPQVTKSINGLGTVRQR